MLTREEALNMVIEATGQEPSEEQKKVILASGGKAIMACAGSGKTTVLTSNLAVDLLTGTVNPNKLLCTTYSKAGATEMQERAESLLKKVGVYAKIEVRTMHSTYYKVLRDFGIVKDVISNGRRRQFIAESCREAKIKLGDDDLDTIDSLLSYQVNNLLDDKGLYNSYVFTLENVTLEQYGIVRNGYSKRKTENNLIDFDDMQMYMYMLLVRDKNQAVLEYCHSHWDSFYVDEFQDISKIQFAILQAMVTNPQKLVLTGDDDQCIYQWRGAAPQFIQNICGYFPLQKFILSTNYRCAGEIVDRAAVGITNNSQRVEKSMQAFNKGGNIWVVPTEDSLVDISQKALEYIDWLCNEKGASPNDIAVLGRNNIHMALLGNMLMRKEYYVNATEGTKLSTTPAFKDIKSVIAIASNTATAEDMKSTLWRCVSFLGMSTARTIGQFMQETMCTPRQAIGYILNECFAYQLVKPADSNLRVPVRVAAKVRSNIFSANAQGIQNLMALYELLTIEDDVERIGKCLDAYYDGIGFMYKTRDRSRWISSIVKYMKNLLKEMGPEKLQAFIHLTEQTEQATTVVPAWCGRVTLSTIHGSKGREWKYVLILADDNKSFPSYDGIMTMEKRGVSRQDISNSLDEGRRLHYVAMTRAKVALAVFAPIDDLGVYLCESFGLIDKGEAEGNGHIISMAEHGQPFKYTESVKKAFGGKEVWTHLDLWDTENSGESGDKPTDGTGDTSDTGASGGLSTEVSEALDMLETGDEPEKPAKQDQSMAERLNSAARAYESAGDTWGTEEDGFVDPYES